jgi:hypothetical protein
MYDYRSKGNPFTRGERPLPLVFGQGKRMDGSQRIRRLRTNELPRIHVRDMVDALPEEFRARDNAEQTCELFGLFFSPRAHSVKTIVLADQINSSQGMTVRFRVTRPNFGGLRWWLECPRCKGLKAIIYGVAYSNLTGCMVACQECLGLTNASRSRHKCLDQDGAILGCQPNNQVRTNSVLARLRAHHRFMRHLAKLGI